MDLKLNHIVIRISNWTGDALVQIEAIYYYFSRLEFELITPKLVQFIFRISVVCWGKIAQIRLLLRKWVATANAITIVNTCLSAEMAAITVLHATSTKRASFGSINDAVSPKCRAEIARGQRRGERPDCEGTGKRSRRAKRKNARLYIKSLEIMLLEAVISVVTNLTSRKLEGETDCRLYAKVLETSVPQFLFLVSRLDFSGPIFAFFASP